MSYQFKSRIRYSETGLDRKLTLESLIDYFQDCSTFHSESCGQTIDRCRDEHRAWMIVSWQIEIERRPELGENIISRTWPYAFKAFYGYRNFALLDENEEYLVKANSQWVLIDTQTGYPLKVKPEYMSGFQVEEPLQMSMGNSRKLQMPSDCIRKDGITVSRHHLDTNNHVNNGQYIRMSEEFIPEDFEVRQVQVEYRKQAMLHDHIVPFVSVTEDVITVALCDEEQKPYAILRYAH